MSDALGALVGGLFGLGSSAMQYGMQRNLMKYQSDINYKYGKKSTLNQYSWQRKGLEKAGYNPLLALGGAEGVANTGWTSSQSAPEVDLNNSALAWLDNARQSRLNKAQVKNTEADTNTKNANLGLIAQEIVGKQLENAYYSRQKESEIALSNAEQFYKLAAMQESLERTYWIGPTAKAQIDSMLDNAKSNLLTAGASVTSAKAQTKNAETNSLDSWRNYDIKTNTRTDSIGLHGPLGIGVSDTSTGYKPYKAKKSRGEGKPYYRTETLKNGKKIRVKVYK